MARVRSAAFMTIPYGKFPVSVSFRIRTALGYGLGLGSVLGLMMARVRSAAFMTIPYGKILVGVTLLME